MAMFPNLDHHADALPEETHDGYDTVVHGGYDENFGDTFLEADEYRGDAEKWDPEIFTGMGDVNRDITIALAA